MAFLQSEVFLKTVISWTCVLEIEADLYKNEDQ